ncbi:hypothetical protein E2C01_047856 [Portunus trituberculatus]|uniref:Uncharacterized protein n=1 Tax=Portunus trituberculatus TaxID=210409 RepID=A0A5B7G257_PORTR|nr:hypothetical protein [Portunus trituberculatus]
MHGMTANNLTGHSPAFRCFRTNGYGRIGRGMHDSLDLPSRRKILPIDDNGKWIIIEAAEEQSMSSIKGAGGRAGHSPRPVALNYHLNLGTTEHRCCRGLFGEANFVLVSNKCR